MSETESPQRRIGVYICHCGGNISDYVDVERVREAISGRPGRGGRQDHAVRLCRRHAARDDRRHPRRGPGRSGRRVLLAEAAHHHVPRGVRTGRPEPVRLHPGEHPRAGLVGAHRRPRGRDPEGHRPGAGRDRQDPVVAAARAAAGRDGARDHGGGRRHHRSADGDRPGRHRHRGHHRRARVGGRGLGRPSRADVPAQRLRSRADRGAAGRDRQAPDDHGAHQRRAGRQDGVVRQLHREGEAAHRDHRGAAAVPGRHVRHRHRRGRLRAGGRRARLRDRRRGDHPRVRRAGRRGARAPGR